MNEPNLGKLHAPSMVQQTIDYLTDAITRREIRPGDKIPTEAELTSLLGVSRNTVREAIKILVFSGVLEIRRPEGTFVRAGFSESLIDPMLYGIILNQEDGYASLMELREMMESGVMQLVMEKATDEEIETLREPLEALKAACFAEEPELDAVFQADNDFHAALTDLGGNKMVIKISNTVRSLTHAMRYESVQEMLSAGRAAELYEAHERLLALLQSRDDRNLSRRIRATYFVSGEPLEKWE